MLVTSRFHHLAYDTVEWLRETVPRGWRFKIWETRAVAMSGIAHFSGHLRAHLRQNSK